MPNAKRDQNNIPTLLGTLETDGSTIVLVAAEPTLHALAVADAATGTNHGPTNALRDQNSVPVLMAVSSVDGATPVAVYATAAGNLLIDSN